jgi:hypothetical protein
MEAIARRRGERPKKSSNGCGSFTLNPIFSAALNMSEEIKRTLGSEGEEFSEGLPF